MVWGAVRSDGTTVLERCEDNVDSLKYQQILNKVLPMIYTRRHLLQQDRATCHTTVSIKRVKLLEKWPLPSPDLNIIENLWNDLKESVYSQTWTSYGNLFMMSGITSLSIEFRKRINLFLVALKLSPRLVVVPPKTELSQ